MDRGIGRFCRRLELQSGVFTGMALTWVNLSVELIDNDMEGDSWKMTMFPSLAPSH